MSMKRELSIIDLFERLQIEYVVCETRAKLYPHIKDKLYWNKLKDYKRGKIMDIALRNKFDTIFDSEDVKAEIYAIVYPDKGMPNFIYKDDEQRYGDGKHDGLEFLDKVYYYAPNSTVKYTDEKLIGTIDLFDEENDIVSIKAKDGQITKHNISEVTRIF